MEDKKIKLSDIAGYAREKEEIQKIIKLLDNYEKYEKAGIYVPKGLILQGPPGCGKTLFATAIANECNIPFYAFQAESDAKASLEKLAGLFKEAKEHTPSIIYIDEIDKITSHRFFSSDAVRTLVQYILTELDGLQSTQGILVIASTNYYDDLPAALVRSGRMDKKINIDYPDLESRIEILNYYIKKHSVFDHVNIKTLALKIKGMSGADIKTLVNNALIEYIDTDRTLVVDDFVDLINQMHFEDIGRRWNNKDTVTKVLIHEAGHSIVNYCLTGKCGSISGIKYGDSAGHTDFDECEEIEYEEYPEDYLPEEDEKPVTKEALLIDIATSFGGMMAEEVFYGNFDAGGISDIGRAVHAFNRMANYYFLDSKYIYLDPERTLDKAVVHSFLKFRDRIFKKQRKLCKKYINSYKYLIRYIVDEAIKNDDTLNNTQIHNCITYYEEHKKEVKEMYKNKPLTILEKAEDDN